MPENTKKINNIVIFFRICTGTLIVVPFVLCFFIFASQSYDVDRMFQIWFAYLSYTIMALQIVSGTHFFIFERAFGAKWLIRMHMWATPAMLITTLLHLFLMAFAKSCKGHIGECVVNVIVDSNVYQIFARLGVLIIIISTVVSVLRMKFKKIPMFVWRIFHYMFYVAFYFITLHIFASATKLFSSSEGHGEDHGDEPKKYNQETSDPKAAESKSDENIFKVVHLILPIYLLILVSIAFGMRIYVLVKRYLNKKKKRNEQENRNANLNNEHQQSNQSEVELQNSSLQESTTI